MKKLVLTLLMVAVVAPSIYACGCGCEKKEGDKGCGMPRCDGKLLKEKCEKEEKAPVVKKEKKAKKAKKDKGCCKKAKSGKKETKEVQKPVEK